MCERIIAMARSLELKDQVSSVQWEKARCFVQLFHQLGSRVTPLQRE